MYQNTKNGQKEELWALIDVLVIGVVCRSVCVGCSGDWDVNVGVVLRIDRVNRSIARFRGTPWEGIGSFLVFRNDLFMLHICADEWLI
jgi:hypothetical protein